MNNQELLEKIAGYLPYKVKMHVMGEIINDTPMTYELTGITDFWCNTFNSIESFHLSDCFPILRPLSDLTKEIEVDGEKFVPIARVIDLE